MQNPLPGTSFGREMYPLSRGSLVAGRAGLYAKMQIPLLPYGPRKNQKSQKRLKGTMGTPTPNHF